VADWWRDAVVYQVYLRSFSDGDGDGIGDIAGLRSRLDHVEELGADAIWVSPWYESPLNDGGYDVANYRSIHPLFGDLDEARALIEDAGRRDIGIIVDLVPNHTSSEHPWFKAAVASPRGSLERSRYHFRPGDGAEGELPPNDWRSVFGGPAWSRVADGDWYLHFFDVTQPDLNWSNEEVRQEFSSILEFWIELGVAGFRVDVAHGKSKHPDYPDVGGVVDHLDPVWASREHPTWDRPEVHEIVRGWRQVVDEHPGTILVAEAWVASWERLARYLRPDEYHQAFDFLFLKSPWDAKIMKSRIDEAIRATREVGAAPTWALSNHDVVRHLTRYGLPQDVDAGEWLLDGDRGLLDIDRGRRRARAAVLLMMGLPGSVYIYQGEELGLPEVVDLPPGVLEDPIWRRSGNTRKGRDGCRVPLPWSRTGASFGFGPGESWLPQPREWSELSVAAQDEDDGSMLDLYRSAIFLRRRHLGRDSAFEWLDTREDVLAFRRGDIASIVNFGDRPFEIPAGTVVLTSAASGIEETLPTDTAVWALMT
jgi:alpha-glucosidase